MLVSIFEIYQSTYMSIICCGDYLPLKGEVVSSRVSSCIQNRDDADDECRQPQHHKRNRSRRIPRSSLQEKAHQELMKKIHQRIADPMEGIEVIIFLIYFVETVYKRNSTIISALNSLIPHFFP
jgi:hypothetical protein